MPKRVDKDPLWRATAKFSRDEVERLISDERIPWIAAAQTRSSFLGACRWGEMARAAWREFEPRYEGGLGAHRVRALVRSQNRRIKSMKTEVPRWMPVHPTLAEGARRVEARRMGDDDGPHAHGRRLFIVPNAPVSTIRAASPLGPELQRVERDRVRGLRPDAIEHCRMPQLGLKQWPKETGKVLGCAAGATTTRGGRSSRSRAPGGARTDILKWVTHGQRRAAAARAASWTSTRRSLVDAVRAGPVREDRSLEGQR